VLAHILHRHLSSHTDRSVRRWFLQSGRARRFKQGKNKYKQIHRITKMMIHPAFPATLTYALGRTLYIPVTCRCNSRTLPETRGPSFTLPHDVVLALQSVRRYELGDNNHNCSNVSLDGDSSNDEARDNSEDKLRHMCSKVLPPLPKVPNLPPRIHVNEDHSTALPSVEQLLQEVKSRVKENKGKFESFVLGGEGEPTLDLETSLKLVEGLRLQTDNDKDVPIPIRMTTNGLAIDFFPQLNDSSSSSVNSNTVTIPSMLKEAGLTSVSVVLMTSDPMQYQRLMEPIMVPQTHSNRWNDCPHDKVCTFIQQSLDCGLDVEVTGVAISEVSKDRTEAFARQLGVANPLRWRTYFP
jgi:hypothetical protein